MTPKPQGFVDANEEAGETNICKSVTELLFLASVFLVQVVFSHLGKRSGLFFFPSLGKGKRVQFLINTGLPLK